MKNVTIQRVPYALSIFGGLNPLIPHGIHVRQISENEHDSLLRHPNPSPKSEDLETLRERVRHLETIEGNFAVAPLKLDSTRIKLVCDSPEKVTAKLVESLQSVLEDEHEIYLASSAFKFGVFIRTSEILVWETV